MCVYKEMLNPQTVSQRDANISIVNDDVDHPPALLEQNLLQSIDRFLAYFAFGITGRLKKV